MKALAHSQFSPAATLRAAPPLRFATASPALVDLDAAREAFAAFPAATALQLLAAAEADITRCSNLLLDAAARGDEATISTARHALRGLCGIFGATALLALAERDLSHSEARRRFDRLRTGTLDAIRQVALEAANVPPPRAP